MSEQPGSPAMPSRADGFLSDQHVAVRNAARAFADREIRPHAAALDEQEEFPTAIYQKMADAGFFGLGIPEDDGGAGSDTLTYAVVAEEISRGYASLADELGNVEMVGTLLATFGTQEQKERYLRPLLRGERVCAFALTESEAGSDLAGLRTVAAPRDGGWVLNGEKILIHNAPNGDFAVVLARTDEQAGHRGMSMFIVERGWPGVLSGRKEHKMGQRASQVGPLAFKDVQLPASSLLGPTNRGFHAMMSVLDRGRIGVAALAVGILQAALEASIAQARTRRQFGQPIAEFQAIQWMLADMAKDIHAARLMTHAAAVKLDRDGRATGEASMAKCFASDAAVARTADAVQIFGGLGYIRGFEVERLYRDAKVTQIYEGTNQIQRMIIARSLLR
jgi:alkylation response protein AidB-like acyl-CoA dehydrogenase